MAIEDRSATDDLSWLERLAEAPGSFDFNAVLRRFEVSFPEKPRLGESARPGDEAIRLAQDPSLAFEPDAITAFAARTERSPARLAIGFFGLWGPNGALPSHLTEYARDRVRQVGDRTLTSLVDIFHHRMLLMFYRAWAEAQPTRSMDRPAADAFATYVGAFIGLALGGTRHRDALPDQAKLHFAGRFSGSTRMAEGLGAIVAEYFQLPTAIDEFVGEWLDLPDDGRWTLGVAPETGSLGRTAVLGARVWSRSHKFRIVLGPLSRSDFERMMPNSEGVATLAALVRLYTNDEWGWDLRLVLAHDVVSEGMRLGHGARLGWTTRLGRTTGAGEDLIVEPATRRTRRQSSRVFADSTAPQRVV